jgi:1,2-diacylglycerol 3-beta-galactosyltransferase
MLKSEAPLFVFYPSCGFFWLQCGQVDIIDLWKEYTPWPFNQAPRAYSFFVKHETLWKLAFHTTAPRVVHQSQMAATAPFVAREVAKGLIKYQPDVIVSVHPLMQHIPLRVLRARGLLHKIPFTTVITDLSTCHPTWFHKLVTRCFCPTNTVAQRALKAGLQPYQLRVHGLPIRPSFSNPTHPKVVVVHHVIQSVCLWPCLMLF